MTHAKNLLASIAGYDSLRNALFARATLVDTERSDFNMHSVNSRKRRVGESGKKQHKIFAFNAYVSIFACLPCTAGGETRRAA